MTTHYLPGSDAARHSTGDAELTLMIAASEPFACTVWRRRAEMNWMVLTIPLGVALVLAVTRTPFRTVVRTGLRASGG